MFYYQIWIYIQFRFNVIGEKQK